MADRMLLTTAALALGFLLVSCGHKQELKSYCLEDPANCPSCSVDADCVIVSNPCHDSAMCSHKDAHLATTMEGCSFENEVPDASECICKDAVCQAR
jgi:hypothetical protein